MKSLYAGARSALRLREGALARSLAARCLKADAGRDFVAPLFKLYVAAEACAACGDLPRAERGLRMALDAEGPRDRVFVHAALAKAVAAQGRIEDAVAWIELVPPQRRPPWLWRRLGELHARADRLDEALRCLEAALHRDRMGRHRTLICMGEVQLRRGASGPAKAAFLEALRLRRKRDQVVDPFARDGLRRALAARGEPHDDPDLDAALGSGGSDPRGNVGGDGRWERTPEQGRRERAGDAHQRKTLVRRRP